MRYIIGFLIFIGMFALVFFLFLHHGSSTTTVGGQPIFLPGYANSNTVMEFTIDGPVVYDTNHQEIRISVGQLNNTVSVLSGYEGQVVSTSSYPNNASAYNEFLHALALDNFTDSKATNLSDVGACASGNRYYLDIINGGDTIQNLWTSTCGEGTFKGNLDSVKALFQAQIPDYGTQTDSANLD